MEPVGERKARLVRPGISALAVAAVLVAGFTAPSTAAPSVAVTGSRGSAAKAVRWIVSDPVRAQLATGSGGIDFQRTVTVAPGTTRAQLLARFPGSVVERDTQDHITDEPDGLPSPPTDDLQGYQWALQPPSVDGGGADILPALGTATGRGVTIAVVDTGIRQESGEFAGRVYPGVDVISDPGVARDGDGRDTDPSDPGDWTTDEPSSWHGTHVAGIALAGAGNGGVVGTAPEAFLLPVRAIGAGGGSSSDIADGITWAVGGHVEGLPDNAHPAQVVNLSLGGSGACPDAYQNAIDLARSRGAVVVVSAGNSNENAAGQRPADCAGVVVVAATDQFGERATYSNYGAAVTLAAPGGDDAVDDGILSVVDQGLTVPAGPTYATYEGTSMAAPFVAGAAADLKELHPDLSADAISTQLRSTASPFRSSDPSFSCTGAFPCGGGILDVAALLAAVPARTVPAAPVGLTSVPTTTTLALGWAPDGDGGSLITDYTVQCSTNGADWSTFAHPASAVPSATLTGLAPGTTYRVRIAAVNAVGTGAFGAEMTSTTAATTPDAPSGLHAAPAAGGLLLGWTPGATGGAPVTDYLAQYSLDGATWLTAGHVPSALPSATITGLRPGTGYQLRVALINTQGPSPFSAPVTAGTAAALRAPAAPGRLRVTVASATSLVLHWTPGSNGGAAVTDDIVQVAIGRGAWHTVAHRRTTAAALAIGGLRPGTAYRLRVALRNSVGAGPASAAVSARTPWRTALSPTVAATGGAVRKGVKVGLTSRLTYRVGTRTRAAAGAWVTVEFDPAGRAGLRTVARVRTGKDGRISYALRASTPGTVRFRSAGGGILAPAVSRATTLKVR